MSALDTIIDDLVLANRALDYEGILDAYGHVSARHPADPSLFLLSCSKSPGIVTRDDIIVFRLDGQPAAADARPLYSERFIHAGVYRARSDIAAVVHSHAEDTLPFGISSMPLRPVIHSASSMGPTVPVWDIETKFGATDLLVRNIAHATDLAQTLGSASVVLMRGHGFVVAAPTLIEVVRLSVYTPKNARVLSAALKFGSSVKYLSSAEIDARRFDPSNASKASDYDPNGPGLRRAWDYWRQRIPGCCNCGKSGGEVRTGHE